MSTSIPMFGLSESPKDIYDSSAHVSSEDMATRVTGGNEKQHQFCQFVKLSNLKQSCFHNCETVRCAVVLNKTISNGSETTVERKCFKISFELHGELKDF